MNEYELLVMSIPRENEVMLGMLTIASSILETMKINHLCLKVWQISFSQTANTQLSIGKWTSYHCIQNSLKYFRQNYRN